mmetsp:Transcript_19565/g.52763  ORF Transcript_19565/g.52763 Transcript_19565/m.52763 type:complete len:441 (+) Transcript_19565:67-1389(+)
MSTPAHGGCATACLSLVITVFQLASRGSTLHLTRSVDGIPQLCHSGHVLPLVIIPGAQKCATTSLFWTLRDYYVRSGFVVPKHKELHFFDYKMRSCYRPSFSSEEHKRCLGAYSNKFPKYDRKLAQLAMDATPAYMRMQYVFEILRGFYAGHAGLLNFIVCVRNPTNRMRSSFEMKADRSLMRNDTVPPISIDQWARAELDSACACFRTRASSVAEGGVKMCGGRAQPEWSEDAVSQCILGKWHSPGQAVYAGLYVHALRNIVQHFRPSQVSLIFMSLYVHRTDAVLKDIVRLITSGISGPTGAAPSKSPGDSRTQSVPGDNDVGGASNATSSTTLLTSKDKQVHHVGANFSEATRMKLDTFFAPFNHEFVRFVASDECHGIHIPGRLPMVTSEAGPERLQESHDGVAVHTTVSGSAAESSRTSSTSLMMLTLLDDLLWV